MWGSLFSSKLTKTWQHPRRSLISSCKVLVGIIPMTLFSVDLTSDKLDTGIVLETVNDWGCVRRASAGEEGLTPDGPATAGSGVRDRDKEMEEELGLSSDGPTGSGF